MTELTHPQRKEIEKALDSLGMSYSLTLPKDDQGYIDWSNDRMLTMASQLLANHRLYAIALANTFVQLEEVIHEVQSHRMAKMVDSMKKAMSK